MVTKRKMLRGEPERPITTPAPPIEAAADLRFLKYDAMDRRAYRFAALLILAAGLLAYSNSFWGIFVFDDATEIGTNPSIQTIWPLTTSMLNVDGTLPARPIPYFTFALNHALHGTSVAGYHIVNLAIHLGCGLLLFSMVHTSCLISKNRYFTQDNVAILVAALVATLWVVHPLTTQAVTYIYQRMESLMVLCYLGVFVTFLRGLEVEGRSRRFWWGLSVVICATGMACKEVMISAPVAVLLYDWIFVERRLGRIFSTRGWYYVLLCSTWGIMGLVIWLQRSKYSEFHASNAPSPSEYFLTQPAAILLYVRLTFLPLGQCIDYGWKPLRNLPEILPPLLAVIAMLIGTIMTLWRMPRVGLVMLLFFLILGITSSFVPVADLVNEHRAYLPSAMLMTLFVLGVVHPCLQWFDRDRPVSRQTLLAIGSVGFFLAILLGGLTYARNQKYHSYEAMWTDATAKAPQNLRAERALMVWLASSGRALESVDRARSLLVKTPDMPERHLNLAIALHLNNEPAEAEVQAKLAIDQLPNSEDAFYILGCAYDKLGKKREAETAFRKSLEILPTFVDANHTLGHLLAAEGKVSDGAEFLERAVNIHPLHEGALQDLAVAYDLLDRTEESEATFRRLLKVNPQHRVARDSYALLLQRLGRLDEAVAQYEYLVEQDPGDVGPRMNLAIACAMQGDVPRGIELLHEAEQIEPGNAEVQANLAQMLRRAGRDQLASTHFRRALAIRPTWAEVEVGYAELLASSRDEKVRNLDSAQNIASSVIRASEGTYLPAWMVLARAELVAEKQLQARKTLAAARKQAQLQQDVTVLQQLDLLEASIAEAPP